MESVVSHAVIRSFSRIG